MDSSTKAIIILILILVLMIAIAIVGSRFLLKRALSKVIRAFRDSKAFDPASARSFEELGFKSRGLLQFGMLRDYKPMAFDLLTKSNIIQQTEDGRLFLSEETLSQLMPDYRVAR